MFYLTTHNFTYLGLCGMETYCHHYMGQLNSQNSTYHRIVTLIVEHCLEQETARWVVKLEVINSLNVQVIWSVYGTLLFLLIYYYYCFLFPLLFLNYYYYLIEED